MNSPLKWHGGKHYLACKIVELMPPHLHYVEPYAGSLAVLLARDPRGVSEVVNDVHGQLTNFWGVLAHNVTFVALIERLERLPFCEQIWQQANEHLARGCGSADEGLCVNCACAFFVSCRQSLAGRMQSFAPLSRTRTRRGMNEQVSAWLSVIEGLPEVHQRLQRVVILGRDALAVISQQDGPHTLFYLDPPYLPDTRITPEVYQHDLSADDHLELLTTIRSCRGRVMLSGYPSEMYEQLLADWTRHDFDLPNHAASGANKRRMTESLWCNFEGI